MFLLSFTATVGTTNIVEASTNLVDWAAVATIFNTNGFVQYADSFFSNYPSRFYRVRIP